MSGAAEPILDATVGYALLGLFGITWIGLGILWGRKATTYEGYAVAGRNVGLAMGAATAVATWITSNTTMLAPELRSSWASGGCSPTRRPASAYSPLHRWRSGFAA